MTTAKLSSRQKVLFNRLTALGEWITAGKLPFKIKEIVGFGSFFAASHPRKTPIFSSPIAMN